MTSGLLESWFVFFNLTQFDAILLDDAWNINDMCVLTDRLWQIWDLFEGKRLFRAVKNGHLDDELHLAEMVSLMGPPPRELLWRSEKSRRYWDEEGQ